MRQIRSATFGSSLGSDRGTKDNTKFGDSLSDQRIISWSANLHKINSSLDLHRAEPWSNVSDIYAGATDAPGSEDTADARGWGRSIEGVRELRSSQPTDSRFLSTNNSIVTAQVSSTAVLHCRTSSATGGLVSDALAVLLADW